MLKKNPPSGRKKITAIRRGNTTVKIYRRKAGRYKGKHYDLFTVAYREDGRRVLKNFRQWRRAWAAASETATRLERGEREILRLSAADWQSYLRAKSLLRPFQIPLHEGARGICRHRKRKRVIEKRAGDVVAELLAAKQNAGLSDRYIETLRTYLLRFADSFQTNIGSINTGAIGRWLDSLKIGPRSRNNVRQAVVTLFNFARRRGYLPKGETTEAADVETVRDHEGEIAILTPAELSKLLKKSKPLYQLYFALAAFSGIRSAELLRLEWSEINFEKGHIEVKARKAKTATRRLVPLQSNLAKWLAPHRRPGNYSKAAAQWTARSNSRSESGFLGALMCFDTRMRAIACRSWLTPRAWPWRWGTVQQSFSQTTANSIARITHRNGS